MVSFHALADGAHANMPDYYAGTDPDMLHLHDAAHTVYGNGFMNAKLCGHTTVAPTNASVGKFE